MERESLKKYVIKMLAFSTELKDADQTCLTFVTSIGLITGRIVNDEASEIVSADTYLSKKVYKFREDYIKEYEMDEAPLMEDDGVLVLKDVQISNNGFIAKMQELVIFYDQIIGVTMGSLTTWLK